MIRLERASKQYAQESPPAVDALSLEVAQGEVAALIGASGCGKTTTLKMINRLIEPSGGEIYIDGEEVRSLDPVQLRRRIGYVFQGVGLFPHYTIAENIAVVPRLLGWDAARVRDRVEQMLRLVDLPPEEYAERMPQALSGGQRQRVGVARALAAEPRVMLLDEPFGALDPITRAELQDELRRIQERLHLTIVLVTHDMTEAMLLANRIAVMHEGRLLQMGTPRELLQEPAHPQVEQLVAMPKERADAVEALLGGNGA